MKKIIKKFWGVGLIVVLLSSLFVAAAPVSAADPLNWEVKTDAPSGAVGTLAPGSDVLDFVVSPDGMTMYAACNTTAGSTLVQSTLGGGVWTNIGPTAAVNRLPVSGVAGNTELTDIDDVEFVAMAPDDPNVVAVADSNLQAAVAISTNGGASFASLGQVGDSTTILKGLEISGLATGGARYIVAYGSTGGAAVLYYRNLGSFGSWANAVTTFTAGSTQPTGQDDTVAFKFSPNFASDYMADAVTMNATIGINLHVLSFNSNAWDGTVASNYPVSVYTGTITSVDKADIALDPAYMGSDESTRIAFIAASIIDGAAQAGNIWRCLDTASQAISATRAYSSVDYDGVNLVAGAYDTNKVYRSADPLAASPTLLASRALKDIGIDQASYNDQVQVMFIGANVFGAKRGTASALSKSTDYGNVWNDFTLLDSGSNAASALTSTSFLCGPGTVDDILVSEAGDPWYLAARDGSTVSIYRMAMFGVTRIMCIAEVASNPNFILRGVAADANVIYAADYSGSTLYYSADGGLTRWQTRLNLPNTVADLAVESANVIYIGSGVNVYKSINAGFTWGLGVNTKVSGNIYRMITVGEGKIIVSSDGGTVAYSTDSGATWTTTFSALAYGPASAQIAATGLSAGDYIFAAPLGVNAVYRCQIGPDNPMGEFKSMQNPAQTYAETNKGIALRDGVLYVLASDATHPVLSSTLLPAIPGTHGAVFWRTRFYGDPASANFGLVPSALKSSKNADGSIRLMSVDTTGNTVYYFDDTVALAGPVLNGPADKSLIQILSQIAGNAQPVNFTWQRLSKSTAYTVWIALDPNFTVTAQMALGVGVGAPVDAYTWAAAVPGNTYYWKVIATSPMTSASSEVRSFTVQPMAATVPIIGGPVSGATVTNLKPAFSWSPVSGATTYKFQLSEGTAFAAPIYDGEVSVAGAQLPLTVTLEDGKTYFWRVKALAPVEGDWSSIANFTVALPVETTSAPPVVITSQPAPSIVITQPPATSIVLPQPEPEKVINPAYIWVIIIIGAVLVIAVIVLIVRTRRTV